jgi:hypothetical protein
MAWTLSKNGAEKSLAEWGLTAGILRRRSFEKDELNFPIGRLDCLAAPLFAYDDTVILRQDGVARFVGRIRDDGTMADSRREATAYRAWNLWDDLETLVYQQNRTIRGVDFVTLTNTPTTAVVLFRDPTYTAGWVPITVLQQVTALLDFAIAQGVSMQRNVSFPAVQAPCGEARDITLAAALRRCQLWMPDAGSWVDYSLSPPRLHILRRSTMGTAPLDLTDGSEIIGINRLAQRNDLVPRGIVLIFLTSETNPADGSTYTRVTSSIAGATTGPRVIISTIDLTALENDVGPLLAVPAGGTANLGNDYFATLSALFFDGSIMLKARECPGNWHPGMLINFVHGRPDWTAVGGIVQEVTEDLFTGQTTLQFGPPPALAAADFLSLLMTGKYVHKDTPGAPGTVAPSGTGGDNQPHATNSVTLLLCGGQTVQVSTPGI